MGGKGCGSYWIITRSNLFRVIAKGIEMDTLSHKHFNEMKHN